MAVSTPTHSLRAVISTTISPPLDTPSVAVTNVLSEAFRLTNSVGDVGALRFGCRCGFIVVKVQELGLLKKAQYWLPNLLVILCSLTFITDANLADNILEAPLISPTRAPLVAPAIPDLPLPANLPPFHRPRRKRLSPHGAPSLAVAPSRPPFYGPLITASHPPTSSRLSKPSMKRSGLVPPSAGLANISPAQVIHGAIPSGLAQPPLTPESSNCCKPDTVLKRESLGCHCVYPIKLDLLLLNISQTPNWNFFLEQFASQLGLRVSQLELINFYFISLSQLNISMDITPHTGISFPASDASAINSSLATHRVQFDPTLVGDYKLLNLTWFEPPAPSQAPVISSPTKAPTYPTPTATSSSTSNKGKHSNLILIIGIGAGLLTVAIIAVLIVCLCAFRDGKTKGSSPIGTAKPRTAGAVPVAGSLPHPTSTRFLAYEELKEATNNFEAASILGEGGFGRVFKGVLSDGTAVAIKRLTNGGQQGDKEFLVEIEMLSRLHHRNLVKLVGYYSSRDSSQHLLCYELVPNGSLEAWLHGPLGAPEGRMNYLSTRVMGTFGLHKSKTCVFHVFQARPILRDKDRLEELADLRLGGKYPKEDFVRVCTIAAACVAPEASQRPTMGEVVQSLKMVQRVTECQDPMLASSNNRANLRQSSTTFESDGTSSMFSSGPYSGLSAFDNDNVSRTAVFSEDLHEGR
ncbi:hypothetical protein EZV62_010280 [Acer yangbiense]|uniref:Protein kinase domain-containing protein n=1 Tax=Acer yangbiense TaxID=1000413 RepID=A0A5C7I3Z0_9ROSI|nr:hypothetical protein EZV62_010280 [Acer yangbiense]